MVLGRQHNIYFAIHSKQDTTEYYWKMLQIGTEVLTPSPLVVREMSGEITNPVALGINGQMS